MPSQQSNNTSSSAAPNSTTAGEASTAPQVPSRSGEANLLGGADVEGDGDADADGGGDEDEDDEDGGLRPNGQNSADPYANIAGAFGSYMADAPKPIASDSRNDGDLLQL